MKITFKIWIIIAFCFGKHFSFSQEIDKNLKIIDTTALQKTVINPLAPSKAAFYSAIVPGLGQAYNKKYWKIPLVYAAMGTSIYFYIDNNKKYNNFRDAYKQRLAGIYTDEYLYLDNSRLIQAQKFYQKNRDLSALITVAFYILNIVDANVDAHLMQYNVNDNLSVKPNLYRNDYTAKQNLGFQISYSFK